MRTMSRRVLKLAALQLAAVAIGTAAALGAERREGGDSVYAHGVHGCTKYAHTVVRRSSWWHDDCISITGTMWAWEPYQTPSYGWREHNQISLNYERYWEVGLFDINGSWHRYNAGYGFWGSNTGVTSAQTKGQCTVSTVDTPGVCYVNSHE
jgi:hypothetical protein